MSVSKVPLVDQQVSEWLTQQRVRRTAPEPHARIQVPARAVTITGEFGALGDSVAQEVAQRLGYALFDRQVIELITKKAQTNTTIVDEVQDRDRSYLQSIFRDLEHADAIDPASYSRRLHEVVGLIGAQGAVVILGRGANMILGPKRALRVRCVAPPELRVARLAERLGLDPHQATRMAAEEDERRVRWVKSTVGCDIRDPTRYDLVLNTAFLTPSQCSSAVVAAYHA